MNLSLMSQSATTTSWSHTPGTVFTDLTKPGLLLQKRSSTLCSRVGSLTCWERENSERVLSNFMHKGFIAESCLGVCESQSMSLALKSSPSRAVTSNRVIGLG